MAHHRIRKFNTKDTYPEQKLDNDLCQAVVTQGGKTVWLRGQCPQNLDDAVNIDSHDPVEQTHKVMQNIRQLIEEAGGSMEHLVKVVVLGRRFDRCLQLGLLCVVICFFLFEIRLLLRNLRQCCDERLERL